MYACVRYVAEVFLFHLIRLCGAKIMVINTFTFKSVANFIRNLPDVTCKMSSYVSRCEHRSVIICTHKKKFPIYNSYSFVLCMPTKLLFVAISTHANTFFFQFFPFNSPNKSLSSSLCVRKRLIQLKHVLISKVLRVRAMNNNNKLLL